METVSSKVWSSDQVEGSLPPIGSNPPPGYSAEQQQKTLQASAGSEASAAERALATFRSVHEQTPSLNSSPSTGLSAASTPNASQLPDLSCPPAQEGESHAENGSVRRYAMQGAAEPRWREAQDASSDVKRIAEEGGQKRSGLHTETLPQTATELICRSLGLGALASLSMACKETQVYVHAYLQLRCQQLLAADTEKQQLKPLGIDCPAGVPTLAQMRAMVTRTEEILESTKQCIKDCPPVLPLAEYMSEQVVRALPCCKAGIDLLKSWGVEAPTGARASGRLQHVLSAFKQGEEMLRHGLNELVANGFPQEYTAESLVMQLPPELLQETLEKACLCLYGKNFLIPAVYQLDSLGRYCSHCSETR